MAFTILSEEELSLLDDGQRVQYERQLKLYQQRVAFVERMEALEGVQIKPYEPQLKPICVINPLNVRTVKKQKSNAVICEPIKTPNLQVKSYQKVEQITPALPSKPKRVDVHTEYIQKSQIKASILPELTKPKEVRASFVRSQMKVKGKSLPAIVMPKMKMRTIAIPAKKQPNLPDVPTYAADVRAFVKPQTYRTELLDVPAYAADVRAFVKPQTYRTELPFIVKPEVGADSYKGIRPVQINLPNISAGSDWDKVEFVKPEQKNLDLPRVETSSVNIRSTSRVERTVPNLPKVKIADIYLKNIKKPEYVLSELPDVMNPSLPALQIKEDIRASVVFSELPKVNIGFIPDAYDILDHLLPTPDKIRKI